MSDDQPDNVYFSWTGSVPQEPWQPSSAFLHFLHTDLGDTREYVRNEAWVEAVRGKYGKTKADRRGQATGRTDKARAVKKENREARKKAKAEAKRAKIDYTKGELYYLNLMTEIAK